MEIHYILMLLVGKIENTEDHIIRSVTCLQSSGATVCIAPLLVVGVVAKYLLTLKRKQLKSGILGV